MDVVGDGAFEGFEFFPGERRGNGLVGIVGAGWAVGTKDQGLSRSGEDGSQEHRETKAEKWCGFHMDELQRPNHSLARTVEMEGLLKTEEAKLRYPCVSLHGTGD